MKYKVSVRKATGRKLEVGKQWNNEPAFGRAGDERRIMKWGRTLDGGFGQGSSYDIECDNSDFYMSG